LVFGIAPALGISRSDLHDTLKANGRHSTLSRSRTRAKSLLVISEIAFSLVLLTGSGLMIGSLIHLLRVKLGFDSEHVLTMRLSLPPSRYPSGRIATFYNRLQAQVRSLPGVQAVAVVNQLPMSDVAATSSFEVEGRRLEAGTDVADTHLVSANYLGAMGITLTRGRFLTEADVNSTPSSVSINQTLARKIWPGEDSIGKRIRLRSDAPWLSVAGVVGDIKNHGPRAETKPEMYFAYTEKPPLGLWIDLRSMTLVVRTTSEAQQMAGAIRQEIKNLDRDLPVYKILTLDQIVSASNSPTRFPTLILSLFAGLAMVMAATGVYGLLAYSVAQSRHEIGVRMALGAQRNQILGSFLGQAIRWAILGECLGLMASLLLVRFMRSLLFEVIPYDVRILAGVVTVLTAVVVAACYVPSFRATKIDPMVSLRYE
jgi:putative ABC transport system permease protein